MSIRSERVPSLQQFRQTCSEEFGFLAEYGFAEVQPDRGDEKFVYILSNGRFFVTVRGENYGLHASTGIRENNGIDVPLTMFVPEPHRKDRAVPTTEFQQLNDIRTDVMKLRTYCVPVFEGDYDLFSRRQREWHRMTDPNFARSVQERRLP